MVEGGKLLALRLLRKLANYSGGAAGGAILTAVTTPTSGGMAIGSLVGLMAVCMATETATESAEPDTRLQRLETWLEELVRRHKRLEEAVVAIAERRETHPEICAEKASLVRILMRDGDRPLVEVEADPRLMEVVERFAMVLGRLGPEVIAALDRQADLLVGVSVITEATAASVGELHQKVDRLLAALPGLPSDDDLFGRAVDELDNAVLRIDMLRQALDEMEFEQARAFADRCLAWLERSRHIAALQRCWLLEVILDEGCTRIQMCRPDKRASEAERVRRVMVLLEGASRDVEEEHRLRATSQLAFASSILESPQTGLELLAERRDPWALRRRISMLCADGKAASAVALVRDEPLDERWAEKGIVAAIENNEWPLAERMLAWSLQNSAPRPRRRCRLVFVEKCITVEELGSAPIQRGSTLWKRFEHAQATIRPLVLEIEASGTVCQEGDAYVLRLGMELAARLEDAEGVGRIADVLQRRRPLDLSLAMFAVRGYVEPRPDWAERYRSEGSSSFERELAALALDARDPLKHDACFKEAMKLAPRAGSKEQARRLHGILMQVAQDLGAEQQDALERVAPSLLGGMDDRQARLWRAGRTLSSGGIVADAELEALRDDSDPLWLQLHAQVLLRAKDVEAGVAELSRAAKLVDQPSMLRDAAAVALAHRKWGMAAESLERVLVWRPGDLRSKSALAMALHRLDRFDEAAALLLELRSAEPGKFQHAINAGVCLIRAGRPDEAVKVLEGVCEQAEAPLEGVLGLSQLLVERGRPDQGFGVMQRHRERFWGRYEFVGAYWTVAFASEHEDHGHEAFVQMRALQGKGAAPVGILVEKNLSDLVALTEAHRERERSAAVMTLQGRTPWLMLAGFRGEPALRAWERRTSAGSWVYERPEHLAESVLYCTNGFTVETTEGRTHLGAITGPTRDREVVADLSSLITLHKLGLLSEAATFCGRLHVPRSYLFKMFADHNALHPHQPSRRTVCGILRRAVAERRVQVTGDADQGEWKNVDEHTPPESAPKDRFHIRDLVEALRAEGLVSAAQVDRAFRVAHRPATSDGSIRVVRVGDALRIALSVLSTLHSCELLDTTLEYFRVGVSPEDRSMLDGEAAWFEAQARIEESHRGLWEWLRDDPRVERHARAIHEDADEEEKTENEVSLDAYLLARRLGMPLFADDRCVQATLLNERRGHLDAAFGTAHLLASMAAAGHISWDVYGSAIHRMMQWRYRFLAPDPSLMLWWARRSATTAPGPELKTLSKYMHECLRDPGLFGGSEATVPPSAMALKLAQSMESAAGDLLGSVWSDVTFSDDAARRLTDWGVAHLLPSPPTALEPRVRLVASVGMPFFFFSLIMRLVQSGDRERARRGMAYVGEALGMTPAQVLNQGVEIIDELAK